MRETKKVLGWEFMIAILLFLAGFSFNLPILMYVGMAVALPGVTFLIIGGLIYGVSNIYKKIKR